MMQLHAQGAYHSEADGEDFGQTSAFVRKVRENMTRSTRLQKNPDPRALHTRHALLGAFRDLLLEGRQLDDIQAAAVAARAGVSRSTLYEHFAGVDGLISNSIAAPFAFLANALDPRDSTANLRQLLEHFWLRRTLARTLFLGPMRRRSIAVLVGLVEQKLRSQGLGRRGMLILPTRLAAVQLAEGMLAPIIAWLAGESRCTSEALAFAIPKIAQAALRAMLPEGGL
jgi:AcrR family transcriptional regulator